MRFVQFLQVLLLLLLGGYLLLISLENPGQLTLPVPFASGELRLPTGLALGLALLTGAAYCALLLLPPLIQLRLRRRREVRRRREAEERLQLTLRSRLGETPLSGSAAFSAAAPAPSQVRP